MIYATADDWRAASRKRVLLMGMSGLGKTHLSNMLRGDGGWFHYSVDYRIGTRYMGELIADNAKAEAMKVGFLAEMLRSDSISITSNITFDNLAPLSAYLGKPGDPALGGLPFDQYRWRQDRHRDAEIGALHDVEHFINRAEAIYDYNNFVCDSSGSICEVVDPWDPEDPVLAALEEHCLLVWLEGTEDHTEELIRRFLKAPKPMYYRPEFLERVWSEYLNENNLKEADVNPNDFIRWTYARALKARHPRYAEIARRGVTLAPDVVQAIRTPQDFEAAISDALAARALEGNG